uniref:Rab-GAP TBC domain-containing protein n=1 Tax=Araucaria cunninghamii TaxID=56994 RepID=A0A0D6R6G4_ARACU
MMSSKEEDRKKESSLNLDWRFNQTLRNVQGLLKGRSFPGKVLLSRKTDDAVNSGSFEPTSTIGRSDSDNELGTSQSTEGTAKRDAHGDSSTTSYATAEKSGPPNNQGSKALEFQKSNSLGRSTDSTRIAKFVKELSASTVELDALRELAWSGVPPYLRPTIWRLLLGYAPPNSDRREGVLMRKRQEYVDCVTQYHDIPDTERTEDEIHMLRQIAVDCPRTVPDVPFFQQTTIQISLERILYTWAIRHPASGYVQGINDLATLFLVVFFIRILGRQYGKLGGFKHISRKNVKC